MMIRVTMLVLVLVVAGCATRPDPQMRMARNAMAAGELELAEFYLEDRLKRDDLPRHERDEAVHMLVQAYWEQGKDALLVDFANARMTERQAKLWWCRVLERRGNFGEAARCWESLGDIARMERAIREQRFAAELTPPKTGVGFRNP